MRLLGSAAARGSAALLRDEGTRDRRGPLAALAPLGDHAQDGGEVERLERLRGATQLARQILGEWQPAAADAERRGAREREAALHALVDQAADDEHYEVTVGASNETVHISQLSEFYYETPSSTELGEFHDDVAWTASSSDAARLEMLRESHTPCLGLRIDNAGIWQALSLRKIKPGEMSHYGTLADLDCPSTEYVKVKMVMLGRDRSIQDEFSQDHLGEPFLVKRELYEVNIAEPSWTDFAASSNRRINLNVGEIVGVRTRLQIEAMLGTGRGTDTLRE